MANNRLVIPENSDSMFLDLNEAYFQWLNAGLPISAMAVLIQHNRFEHSIKPNIIKMPFGERNILESYSYEYNSPDFGWRVTITHKLEKNLERDTFREFIIGSAIAALTCREKVGYY